MPKANMLADATGESRLAEIRAAIARYGISPRRRRGQHFLADLRPARLAASMAREAMPSPQPLALEIGCGMGHLTGCLVQAGFRVLAIELDAGLCALARERIGLLGAESAVTFIECDALEHGRVSPAVLGALDGALAAGETFALVSNLPYSIAAPVICHFAVSPGRLALGTVMVQREMAERMCARPATRAWGSLGLLCSACFSETRILKRVRPGAFYPRPRVEGAIVQFRPGGVLAPERNCRGLAESAEGAGFAEYAKRVFTQRRRRLAKAASVLGLAIPKGVSADRRIEALELAEHLAVFRANRPGRR